MTPPFAVAPRSPPTWAVPVIAPWRTSETVEVQRAADGIDDGVQDLTGAFDRADHLVLYRLHDPPVCHLRASFHRRSLRRRH
jgi:hypothetical protein